MFRSQIIALVILLSLWDPIIGWGQTTVAGKPVDIVLALDNSGSMKKNDPNALMGQAVAAFARGLKAESRLGIVAFSQGAEVALGLTGTSEQDFLTRVDDSLRRLDYSGQRTDIPAGVERAIYELRDRGRPEAQRVVVFFTDGIVDVGNPARDLERASWLRGELAQDAKRTGIRIFGVAFTEGADFQLIQSVSQVTDGDYFRVLAASDIGRTFIQIRERVEEVARPEVVAPSTPSSVAPPAAPVLAIPWPLAIGGVVLLLALVVAVPAWRRARSSKPSVDASLRDLGGHTGLKTHSLNRRTVRIGRDAQVNDIAIPHETISSQHAAIEFRDGMFYLRDLRSSNGTFVNGKKVSDPEAVREVPLKHGDHIRFDAYEFEFAVSGLELPSAEQRGVIKGDEVSPGGTRLRRQPAPAGPVSPVEAPRPQDPGPPSVDGSEGRTKLKPDMCPNHPAWKATELCPSCKRVFCKNCMTEKDRRFVCPTCAAV